MQCNNPQWNTASTAKTQLITSYERHDEPESPLWDLNGR